MKFEHIISELKAIRIPYKAEKTPEGKWTTWPEFAPGLWGEGHTQEESIDDMINMWREAVECSAWQRIQPVPEDMPFYAKILISTDEELRECLSGEICAVS